MSAFGGAVAGGTPTTDLCSRCDCDVLPAPGAASGGAKGDPEPPAWVTMPWGVADYEAGLGLLHEGPRAGPPWLLSRRPGHLGNLLAFGEMPTGAPCALTSWGHRSPR